MRVLRGRHRRRRASRVELLPLMDVMFLLLVFFIYLSLEMTVRYGVHVDLVRTGAGDIQKEARPLVVTVRHDGSFYLQKKAVAGREALTEALVAILQAESRPVVLNADRESRHGDVVQALAAIRKAGVKDVVQAVESAPE